MPNFIGEDDIEQALLGELEAKFGFELLNCYTTDPADLNDRSLRQDKTHGSPIFEQGVHIGLESYHEKACNRNNRKSR